MECSCHTDKCAAHGNLPQPPPNGEGKTYDADVPDFQPTHEMHALKAAEAIVGLINETPRTPSVLTIAQLIAAKMPAVTINRHPTEAQMQREDAAYSRGRRDAELGGTPCCGDFEKCTRACWHRGFHDAEKRRASAAEIKARMELEADARVEKYVEKRLAEYRAKYGDDC
jgi:hypothetical protein